MRVLFLDCETSPNQVFTWGIWQQNISINHMIESSGVMCWSAKWLGEKKVHFDSIHKSSKRRMLKGVHDLLTEADVVVTYNGKSFDTPVLNREFLLMKMPPPAPCKQLDVLQVARRQFRFQSNKLEYVARELGFDGKTKHEGFKLWVKCMNSDPVAWAKMEQYNKNDSILLEKVYNRVLAWIPHHPNRAVYSGQSRPSCTKCGSTNVQARGFAHTISHVYARFVCKDCGAWLRGRKSLRGRAGAERLVECNT